MKLSEKFSLAGKTALVTGSSQGIGKGIAIALAEYGADIILHYRKDRSEAEAVAKEIKTLGVKTYIVKGDLSKTGGGQKIVLNASVLTSE
jgi:glucose 1-dehydrogenase